MVDRFSNQNYLNSGLTIKLDVDKVLSDGSFTIHILCNDVSYRYEPITYNIER